MREVCKNRSRAAPIICASSMDCVCSPSAARRSLCLLKKQMLQIPLLFKTKDQAHRVLLLQWEKARMLSTDHSSPGNMAPEGVPKNLMAVNSWQHGREISATFRRK